jgi:hypothetical protein
MKEEAAGSPPGDCAAEATCRHHWLIEPPNGPTSIGVCKLCGATREFDNQLPPRPAASARVPAPSNDEGVLTSR